MRGRISTGAKLPDIGVSGNFAACSTQALIDHTGSLDAANAAQRNCRRFHACALGAFHETELTGVRQFRGGAGLGRLMRATGGRQRGVMACDEPLPILGVESGVLNTKTWERNSQ